MDERVAQRHACCLNMIITVPCGICKYIEIVPVRYQGDLQLRIPALPSELHTNETGVLFVPPTKVETFSRTVNKEGAEKRDGAIGSPY